jgi:hypothetical protein
MELRRELFIKDFKEQLEISDKVMLSGSCFTEHLGARFRQYHFPTIQNPNGIIFNPVSISKSITSYISNRKYTSADIFFNREWWTSWDHHTSFSHSDPEQLLQMINRSQQEAHDFLKTADWLIITLGSAFVYQLENGEVVANCHKVPADKFRKKLMHPEDVLSVLDNMIHRLFMYNEKLRIIFTISPVRHLRDGFIENNRSKAMLIQTVHHLVDKFQGLYYFPAYELVIDDLRDYRFYAEDMVHPNYLATDYVWEKFCEACITKSSRDIMKEINQVNAAKAHKPFQPESMAHKVFLQNNLDKVLALQEKYPYINFTDDINFFSSK